MKFVTGTTEIGAGTNSITVEIWLLREVTEVESIRGLLVAKGNSDESGVVVVEAAKPDRLTATPLTPSECGAISVLLVILIPLSSGLLWGKDFGKGVVVTAKSVNLDGWKTASSTPSEGWKMSAMLVVLTPLSSDLPWGKEFGEGIIVTIKMVNLDGLTTTPFTPSKAWETWVVLVTI